MTKDEYIERVKRAADDSLNISLLDYADAMEELADEFSSRADAAREDLRRAERESDR